MCWIASLLFISIIYSSSIEVVVKETSWANIVENVQIFKHLNKMHSKSPLHEANEFQVFEPVLVAKIADLWDHFDSFSLYSFYFIYVYVNVVTGTGLQIPCGVGQESCRVWAWVLCSCSWSCEQWILVLCLPSYNFSRFVSTTWDLWLYWFLDLVVGATQHYPSIILYILQS